MTESRPGPYVHVSWLSKLMAGSVSCHWQMWFQAHFKNYSRAPRNYNQAKWQMDHTRLMNEVGPGIKAESDTVRIERQNDLWHDFPNGITLSGTPDIVAVSGNTSTVYDVKAAQPNAAHQIQVMLYMYCLPRSDPKYEGMTVDGCVIYAGSRVPIPASVIDEQFEDNLNHFLSIIDTRSPPDRTPSEGECAFCNIGKDDCPDRIDARKEAVS